MYVDRIVNSLENIRAVKKEIKAAVYASNAYFSNAFRVGSLNLKRARCHEPGDSALKTQVAKINRPTRAGKREVVSGA